MILSKFSNSSDTTPLQDITNKVIAQFEAMFWAVEYQDQILLAKLKIQDKRLIGKLRF